MKIGVVGLGKLGLPIAKAVEARGHEVLGNDIDKSIPFQQDSIKQIVSWADLVLVIVQTPHGPEYEGVTRLPDTREDFNYEFLIEAIKEIAEEAKLQKRITGLVVVSTCLPGTYEREIRPMLNDKIRYLYSPAFTAMGTVADDLYNAEFNIIGWEMVSDTDYPRTHLERLLSLYASLNDAETVVTDIKTAEAVKVAYNTFVTAKTVLGNVWGELSHKMGIDFSVIKKTWSLSRKRLISDRYLESGMADGGACHPRDNIAMSWVARKSGLSYDYFESLMMAREKHTEWLANIACELATERQLPLVILGKSFKPETDIEIGSPSKLLFNLAKEHTGVVVVHEDVLSTTEPAVIFIGTKNKYYAKIRFPKDSVVIDPFRYIKEQDGVELISIGGKCEND